MQCDLYLAFLAWCVGEDGQLHADQARVVWSGAVAAPAGSVEPSRSNPRVEGPFALPPSGSGFSRGEVQ